MTQTEEQRNQPLPGAVAAAIEVGRSRKHVEAVYLEARAAFIEAAQQLDHYGKRYAQRIAACPKGYDLTKHAETSQEPMTPLAPVASELEWSEE